MRAFLCIAALFVIVSPLSARAFAGQASDPACAAVNCDHGTASDSVFVHAVYFWLHDHVSDAQKQEFVALLRTFSEIRSVTAVYVGVPAGTPRTIVDNSYDVSLIVHFRDKAGHDAYQVDPLHKEAIRIFEGWIREIRIYDMIGD